MNVADISQLVGLMRLRNAVHPSLAIVASFLLSGSSEAGMAVLAIVVYILLHSFVTIWNDIEDREIDALNGRNTVNDLFRSHKKSWLIGSLVFLLGTACIGALFLPFPVAGLLIIYIGLAWLYNSRVVAASRRPIASIIILWLCYGLLPVLCGLSFGEIGVIEMLFAFAWSINRAALSLLKDFKDASGDSRSDKRTFMLVYGKTRLSYVSFVLSLTGLAGVVLAVGLSGADWIFMAGLVGLAIMLLAARLTLFKRQSYAELHQIFVRSLQLQAVFDAMVVVCLAI